MLGSAPFLHAVSVGAEFSPRAQAGAAAGAANCRFEQANSCGLGFPTAIFPRKKSQFSTAFSQGVRRDDARSFDFVLQRRV